MKKIYSFHLLRTLSCIAVFFSHLVFLENTSLSGIYCHINYARFPVDVFFVLSGFLMAYMYQERIDHIKWLDFVEKRYEKIYIPYLLSSIIGGVFFYLNNSYDKDNVLIVTVRILASIPILQSLVAYRNIPQSFTGVGWFLSCTMVFYMLTPVLLRINRRIKNKSKYLMIFFFLNLIIFGIVYMIFRELEYYRFPELHLSLVYSSPYIRIFSFVSGIICFDIKEIIQKGSYNLPKLEIPLFVLSFIWWVFAGDIPLPMVIQEIISIIFASMLILVFSFDNGILSNRVKKCDFLMLFSEISMEFYIIHYIVINMGIDLFGDILIKNTLCAVCGIIFFFVSSYICATIFHRMSVVIVARKRKKRLQI